jgi:thiamine transporter 2/3
MTNIIIYFSANILATIWSLFLPSVNQSIYFHRSNVSDEEHGKQIDIPSTTIDQSQHMSNSQESLRNDKNSGTKNCFARWPLFRKIRNAYALLWKHFVQAYTNYRVVKWSAWWALSTCGYLQIVSYIQLLWKITVQPSDKIYNGAVDFLYAILGERGVSDRVESC